MPADVASIDWYNEDSAPPLTTTKPAGFGSGQRLVAVMTSHGGALTDLTAAAGWTLQDSFIQGSSPASLVGKVWTWEFTGSEPATWDFGYLGSADVCLGMFRITGADTATPATVCTHTLFASGTSSMDSPTVTPTGANDLLICLLGNVCGGTVLAETDPAGMTDRSQTQIAGNFNALAGVSQQLSSSSATGVRTWTSVTPTGQISATLSIAVKSSTTTLVYPPGRVRRGRLAVPVRARRRTSGPVPAQIVVAAPAYPPKPVHRTRQLLGRLRGRTATPVPAQVVIPAPPYPPKPVHRTRQLLGRLRGRQATPVPAQVVVAPPYVPQVADGGRRAALLRQARRRTFAPVPDQTALVPAVARRARQLFARLRGHAATSAPEQAGLLPAPPHPRRPAAPARRGKAATPAPPQVTVITPTWSPPASHSRRFAILGRRGKQTGPVPPQIVVAAPSYIPTAVRRARQVLGRLRGRPAAAVPPQTVTPPVPVHRPRSGVGRNRPRVAGPVPGQIVVTPPAYPPKPVHRLRQALGRIHGHTATPVPAQIVIPAPPYPPAAKRRRLGWLLPRRARTSGHPLTCDCTCHRPDTGTTARPSTGTVAYDQTMLTRPDTGTVTRPDTGIVEDPCC